MSGIALLRRLLMKQAMKKSADSSGIMSLNKNIVNDVDITVKKWIDSAKKQGQDIDKMGEQEIKYLIELNKPKAPHTLTELMEKIGLNDPKKNKFLQKEGKVIQADFDKSNKWFKGKSEGVEDVSFKPGKDPYGRVIEESPSQIIVRMKAMTPMDAMKEANLVIARKGKYKNLTIDESQDILKKTNDHIFERDIKYDEFGEVIKPDPEDLAHGGRTGYGIGTLVKEKIPPEYRLYAKSILPGGESGKVGSDYFPESFKRELRAQALDKYKRTGKLTGQVGETDQGRSYRKGEATLNKLLQFPSTYASLGTYTYDIDPKTMDVRVTDKYDWNPDYGTRKILGEEMTGWHKPTRSFKGKDVDLGMFKQLAKESWKKKSIDKANLLEMVGNYFGGKESEGKGFDVDIDIPTKEATPATEGSFAHGGRTGSGLNYLLGEDDQNSRVPYADGSKFNPKRRGFLKLAAGLASIPLIGKYFKWAKPLAKSSKVLTSVPIGNVSGMPAWFKPLVNKVIKEGDDVTKKFATQEREIVHQVSLEGKVGKDALGVDDVRVTQSLDDGTIRVQYNTVNSPGEYGVDLIYKKGEEIPLKGKKGSVKTKDEFSAAEAEPQYTGGPEDADIEWAGENVVNKVDDLLTDTTKLETYATGKNPTIKKLLKSEQKQKKTQQLNESNSEQANFIEEKYGPGPDPSDLVDDLVDDFASGGRVPLAGGLIVKGGNWLIKALRGTREAIKKNKDYSPERIKLWVGQIDDQIRSIQAGGPIPDEVIQKIRSDPKFKGVWQNQKSLDPELREMEEVLLEYGQKHASGGLAGMLGE